MAQQEVQMGQREGKIGQRPLSHHPHPQDHPGPEQLQEHLRVESARVKSYSKMRELIRSYLTIKRDWRSLDNGSSSTAPRDVNAFTKGEDKGKRK